MTKATQSKAHAELCLYTCKLVRCTVSVVHSNGMEWEAEIGNRIKTRKKDTSLVINRRVHAQLHGCKELQT